MRGRDTKEKKKKPSSSSSSSSSTLWIESLILVHFSWFVSCCVWSYNTRSIPSYIYATRLLRCTSVCSSISWTRRNREKKKKKKQKKKKKKIAFYDFGIWTFGVRRPDRPCKSKNRHFVITLAWYFEEQLRTLDFYGPSNEFPSLDLGYILKGFRVLWLGPVE